MKWNNIDAFLNALENRMEQLEANGEAVTSSTEIVAGTQFSEDELNKFDSIKEEAEALCKGTDDILEYMCNRLSDLGYNDDEITQILDYEGV